MKRTTIFLIAIMFVSAGATTYVNGFMIDAESLYEKTLLIESTERDMRKAIKNYRRIIASTKKKDLRAKAYLRMSICYDNLGNREKAQEILTFLTKN
ncbi:MAG: hypothetical protein GF384_04155, partial [Elusimicrobia bacterium]|nr:hypothetical protein [Elusimicrobiota bacterium]